MTQGRSRGCYQIITGTAHLRTCLKVFWVQATYSGGICGPGPQKNCASFGHFFAPTVPSKDIKKTYGKCIEYFKCVLCFFLSIHARLGECICAQSIRGLYAVLIFFVLPPYLLFKNKIGNHWLCDFTPM